MLISHMETLLKNRHKAREEKRKNLMQIRSTANAKDIALRKNLPPAAHHTCKPVNRSPLRRSLSADIINCDLLG
jgi:hypothetical protein